MKKIGYILLQIGGYLILVGGITDFAMTFYSNSLPAPHLKYLKIKNEAASFELKNLDYAFLRAIGGCLIGIGIGTLTIIYGSLREKTIWPLIGMLEYGDSWGRHQCLTNVYAKFIIFCFPLACIIITWIGTALWWIGDKREQK